MIRYINSNVNALNPPPNAPTNVSRWQLATRPNYIYDTTITRSQNRGYIFYVAREINWIFAASYIICAVYTMTVDTLLINLYSLVHMAIIYVYLAYMGSLHLTDLTLPTDSADIARIARQLGIEVNVGIIQNITRRRELFWVKLTRILSLYISISWYIIFVYYLHESIDLTKYMHLTHGATGLSILAPAQPKSLMTVYIFSMVALPTHIFTICLYTLFYTVDQLLYMYFILFVTSVNISYMLAMWLLWFNEYGLPTTLIAIYAAAHILLILTQILTFVKCWPISQNSDMTNVLHVAIVAINYAGLIILLLYINKAGAS